MTSDNNDYVQIGKTDYIKKYRNNGKYYKIDSDATEAECNNTATATKYPIGKSYFDNFDNDDSDTLIPSGNEWTIEATTYKEGSNDCDALLYWMKPTVSTSSYTTGTPAVKYNFIDPSVVNTITTTTDYFIGSVKSSTKTVTKTKVLWRTKKIGGYVADYQIRDIDNDGQNEIVLALVLSVGPTLKTNSCIVAYKLPSPSTDRGRE